MLLINNFLYDVLLIIGSTAVGKTNYAIFLALLYDAEIINCDLMQVYVFGKIGSGQVKNRDQIGIPHHLLGFCCVPESISVYQMRLLVEEKILEIKKRNKRVIVVGGSLFFVISLFFIPNTFFMNHYSYSLYKDRVFLDKEVFSQSKNCDRDKMIFFPLFNYSVIFINCIDIVSWRQRCLGRIKEFLAEGILSEYAEMPDLWKKFLVQKKKVIGYFEASLYFAGVVRSEEEYVEKMYFSTCQYGKKQRTYMRKLHRDFARYGVVYKDYFF